MLADEQKDLITDLRALFYSYTPDHYLDKISAIDVIRQFDPHFNQAQILKYAFRLEKKDQKLSDLLKIVHYAVMEMENELNRIEDDEA